MDNRFILKIVRFDIYDNYFRDRIICSFSPGIGFNTTSNDNKEIPPKTLSATQVVYAESRLELLHKNPRLVLKIEQVKK